jgi:hypothetical protein
MVLSPAKLQSPPPPPRARPPVPASPVGDSENYHNFHNTSHHNHHNRSRYSGKGYDVKLSNARTNQDAKVEIKFVKARDLPQPAPHKPTHHKAAGDVKLSKTAPPKAAPPPFPPQAPPPPPSPPRTNSDTIIASQRLALSRIKSYKNRNAAPPPPPSLDCEIEKVKREQVALRRSSQPPRRPQHRVAAPEEKPQPVNSKLETAQINWSRLRALERVRNVKSKAKHDETTRMQMAKAKEDKIRKQRQERIDNWVKKEEEKEALERKNWAKDIRREGRFQESKWREVEQQGGPDVLANAVDRVTERDCGRKTLADFEMYLADMQDIKHADFVEVRRAESDSLMMYTQPSDGEVLMDGNDVDGNEAESPVRELAVNTEDEKERDIRDILPTRIDPPPQAQIVKAIPKAAPEQLRAIQKASYVIDAQRDEIRRIQERVRTMQAKAPETPVGKMIGEDGGRDVMSPDSLMKQYPVADPPWSERGMAKTQATDNRSKKGNTIIHVHSAHDLPQPLSSCNAYCVIKVYGDTNDVMSECRTGVCKNTVNPVFDKVKITATGGWSRCEILMYTKNVFISDEYIGKAMLGSEDVEEEWAIDLIGKSGNVVGKVKGRVDQSWFA